ncbi:MAG: Rrf2 family transcriptional regulator [Candidatus Sumerlaeia bacterium]|nr:Rrf2 family transcriptional regulator [Candidatus Sumerlaeia bacterium]
MLSQTAEYALRAALVLAHHDPVSLVAADIAATAHVPPDYLAKVMQALRRGGLVRSRRGYHGGFSLSRPATAITILDVIHAVEPTGRLHECPLGLACHESGLCALHRSLDEATAAFERHLAGLTLAAVLRTVPGERPMGLPAERDSALDVPGGGE